MHSGLANAKTAAIIGAPFSTVLRV